MRTALFLSMQRSQSVMFGLTARALIAQESDVQPVIVTADAWNHLDAESPLRKLEVPFLSLAKDSSGSDMRNPSNTVQALLLLNEARAKVQALLKEIRPHIVIVGADIAGIAQLFIQYASDMQIPTLLVQDGALQDKEFKSSMRRLGAYEYGCGGCTHIAVTGKFDLDVMQLRKIEPPKITVTGQPRYDLLISNTEEAVFGELLPPDLVDSRLILFASQPAFVYPISGESIPVDELTLAQQVITACQPLSTKYVLVIKLHPREALETYAPLLSSLQEESSMRVHITRDMDIYELLRQSELVIVPGSTVAQEAVLLDKPVIALSYAVPHGRSYLSSDPAVIDITNPADLPEAIQKALSDESIRQQLSEGREAFVAKRLHRADGKSSDRVAELIVKLINTRGIGELAATSHALAPLRIYEALEFLENNDVEHAVPKLIAALERDRRILDNPQLLVDQFLSRTYLRGEGSYHSAAAIHFAKKAAVLLDSLQEPIFKVAKRQFLAQLYWAISREINQTIRLSGLRYWLQAALYNPAYLTNRGFWRTAYDMVTTPGK